jgi:hypothetical protein
MARLPEMIQRRMALDGIGKAIAPGLGSLLARVPEDAIKN